MNITIKSLLIFFFFLCVDGLIAGGISELWVRSFIPVTNICYDHDPILGDTFCPNQVTYGYVEKGYKNIFKNNSLGFHDIERNKTPPKNTIRIHVYGDSLTAAAGVPIQETIPSLLEKYINKNHTQTPVEVLNMAPAEDSTVAQYLTFQHIGQYYSPDIVICYFMNDFHDNIIETHHRTRSPYYNLGPNNNLIYVPPVPVDTASPWEKFKRWSSLYRIMANKFLASKIYHNMTQWKNSLTHFINNQETSKQPFDSRNKYLREKAWPVTLKLLIEFKNEVENAGAKFILVDGYPITPKTSGGYTNNDLETFCNSHSISYIPMYQDYQQMYHGSQRSNYFFEDSHPNVRGNRKLGMILANKLLY